ncbi:hypothetical protein [Brachybacterium sacelli]
MRPSWPRQEHLRTAPSAAVDNHPLGRKDAATPDACTRPVPGVV